MTNYILFSNEEMIYLLILPIITTEKKKTLGAYLAGLIEGDGSIVIPSRIKNSANKLQYPSIKVSFPTKELPFFTLLTTIIGGKIQNTKGNYKIWAVQDKGSLIKIVSLINGQMRTPKIEALYRLIDWFHLYGSLPHGILQKKPLDSSSLLETSWFTGFIEADGSFHSSLNLNKDGVAINLKRHLNLSQRQNYHRDSEVGISYLPIMTNIQKTFNVSSLITIERDRGTKKELGYNVRMVSNESCIQLINYFNLFPLFTSKFLDYLIWKEFHQKKGKVKNIEETKHLIQLKENMNQNRTSFDWTHLNQFYRFDNC